jgi:hypothetical protein
VPSRHVAGQLYFTTTTTTTTTITTSVRSKLEYASIVWDFFTFTNASKIERIQRKFLALCYNRFFPQIHYSYVNALVHQNFHILCTRRRQLEGPFLENVRGGFKFCSTLLETVGICDPIRNVRDFSLFNVGSARCASAAYTVLENSWLHFIIF